MIRPEQNVSGPFYTTDECISAIRYRAKTYARDD
jgi:hypothetical protein